VPLPPDVLAFLRERVSSVAELDVLLLLHRDPERAWTAQSASVELYRPDVWVAGQLEGMVATGLARRQEGEPPSYRWDPADPGIAVTVKRVAEAFRLRHTSVIGAIYAPRGGAAERFADAFRLRPDKEEED